MASTTFSGPVTSNNGFVGSVTATTLATSGAVIFSDLPTTDPLVEGQLWNDAGVLSVSAG